MALRNLNCTAIARERSTGMRKGGRSLPPVPPLGANDENVDLLGSPNPPPRTLSLPRTCLSSPLPVCTEIPACRSSPSRAPLEAPVPGVEASAEVDYVNSADLPDLAHPDDNLNSLIERLDSKDWLIVCEAIINMRQLVIYHASSFLPYMEKTIPLLVKAMKNPRSALCKTAIMASVDLFKAYPDAILDMLEQLLLQLLLKASQDKKFVCDEAERSLEVMTECLAAAPLLMKLQPNVTHRNPKVRAKAASCVYRSVAKLGSEGIKEFGFQPLLQIAASQLNDQLPEARESSRKVLAVVYAAYPHSTSSKEVSESDTDQQDWFQFCNRELSSHVAQAILRLTSTS